MSDTPLKLDAAPLANATGDDPWQAAASAKVKNVSCQQSKKAV